MNKFNKKGFTLIEMLVVIAIIAVLVSIIIPTVSSATGKAKAATDAANLRSLVAEATTDYLNGQEDDTGMIHFTPATSSVAANFAVQGTAPKAKSVGDGATSATITMVGDVFVAKYGDYTLEQFAYVAENGGTLEAAKTAKPEPSASPAA